MVRTEGKRLREELEEFLIIGFSITRR